MDWSNRSLDKPLLYEIEACAESRRSGSRKNTGSRGALPFLMTPLPLWLKELCHSRGAALLLGHRGVSMSKLISVATIGKDDELSSNPDTRDSQRVTSLIKVL